MSIHGICIYLICKKFHPQTTGLPDTWIFIFVESSSFLSWGLRRPRRWKNPPRDDWMGSPMSIRPYCLLTFKKIAWWRMNFTDYTHNKSDDLRFTRCDNRKRPEHILSSQYMFTKHHKTDGNKFSNSNCWCHEVSAGFVCAATGVPGWCRSCRNYIQLHQNPYHPCMVYLPTCGCFEW